VTMPSCRNLLIYLGGQLQEQVMPLFHYALRSDGFLFLGVSKTITRHADLFVPEDRSQRIFWRRRHTATPLAPLQVQPVTRGSMRPWPAATLPSRARIGGAAELRGAAEALVLEQFAPAHVVVNHDGDIVHQSARLGKYLEPDLKPKVALTLSMVLHKLATNAAKYGALSGERGCVTVTWSTEGEGLAAQLVLRWVEEGGPAVSEPPERRGFGSELIDRQVCHDLGGSMEVDFAETGLHATLAMPVNTTAALVAPRL
jgi:hypothetical protein